MDYVVSVFEIILVNLVLSGDNAVVIALATRKLPPEHRRRAVFWGGAVAILTRIAFTVPMAYLVMVPGLRLVGGFALALIACKLLLDDGGEESSTSTAENAWAAIRTIFVADVVMSLDNMLAVAGASRGDTFLLSLGLVVSMVMIMTCSTLIAGIMDRFKWVAYAGTGILAFAAAELMSDDREVARFFVQSQQVSLNSHWNEWMLTSRPVSTFAGKENLPANLRSVVNYRDGELTFAGCMTETQRDALLATVSVTKDRRAIHDLYKAAHVQPVPAWLPASIGPTISGMLQEKWPAECWQSIQGRQFPAATYAFYGVMLSVCMSSPIWWPGKGSLWQMKRQHRDADHPYVPAPSPVPSLTLLVHEGNSDHVRPRPLRPAVTTGVLTGDPDSESAAIGRFELEGA